MSGESLNTGTWRRKRALASWQYSLPMPRGIQPAQALCAAAERALSAVEDFGVVVAASWTTESSGEDARVDLAPNISSLSLRKACEELGDVKRLDLDLDLCCVDLEGREGLVPRGATLVVDLDFPDPAAPDHGLPDLDLVVQLNVDIHAPRTCGSQRDNRALASLNGPRLTAFLMRIRSVLRATLVDMDAYAGTAAIDADGWVDSSETRGDVSDPYSGMK